MKRFVALLSIMAIFLTGCGSWSPQSVNMDDPDYNYEDEYNDCDDECDCDSYDGDYFKKEDVWAAINACEDYQRNGYESLEDCFSDNY